MRLDLSHIGQIGLGVGDVDRSEQFYETTLGLRKLFRFGDLSFFDCSGVRLLLEKAHDAAAYGELFDNLPALRRHCLGGC